MQDNRSNNRKSVGLLVKLTHQGVDEFAEKYATNLSDGGMFIRTREPQPVGTEIKFKVEIASGQRVLQGVAVVRWTRGPNDPAGPAGMGLQFTDLDEASRALVLRMLAGRDAATLPAVVPAGLQPASATGLGAPAPAALAPPRPSPGAPLASPPVAPRIAPAVAPAVAPAQPFDFAAALAPPRSSPPGPRGAAAPVPPPPTARTPGLSGLFDGVGPAEEPPQGFPSNFGLDPAAAPPRPDPGKEIDLDLDALIAATPQPPPAPAQEEVVAGTPLTTPVEVDVDVSDTSLSALPEIRRGVRPAAPAPSRPVVLDAKAAPAPAPPPVKKGGPVFLTGKAPAAATGPVIGIDLGTTNSACAVLSKGRPLILNSKDGYNTIPSVVALTTQGKLMVGHRAKQQLVLNPTRSIFGAKRLVGRDFDSPTVAQVRERYHYEICPDEAGRAAVRLGEHTLALEEVQGLILRECKEMAEQVLGVPVARAVVTCPAYYSEPQREAVRRAGAMAGLKVERVLNEPTAAALAFGMNKELSKTVLVYDLGGGTFDATLLKLDQNVFEVLATGGDVFLGGVDFDNQIIDLLLEHYQRQFGRPFAGDQVALSRIGEAAERAKVALSERATFDVHLPMLEMDPSGTPRDLKCTVTRAEVEKACSELVDRTVHAVQDVLLDARLKPEQVDDVILVGGMSRMPLVREKLKQVFKKPPQASVNADEAVALGAALYSGTVDKVSSLVLIDVVPMTVGLGKPGGGFHRLIERNTPLPATKSFGIATHEDNQQVLEVMVFQGEDSNVSGNEFLGAVRIEGLPKGPKGSVQVAITLSLDAECVLKVEAREFRTRKVVQATLATRYTSEEIAGKLGISGARRSQALQARAEELQKRAGGFWSKVKKVFGRG